MALMALSSSSAIAKNSRFLQPPEKVVALASVLGYSDFPRLVDILAIARIESSFNEKARNGVSIGIMQVNHGPWAMEKNLAKGVEMLRDLYVRLGSIKAAVLAYNCGEGCYRKGRAKIEYYQKFIKAKEEYHVWIEEQGSRLEPDANHASGSYSNFLGYVDSSRSPILLLDWSTCEGCRLERSGNSCNEGDSTSQ